MNYTVIRLLNSVLFFAGSVVPLCLVGMWLQNEGYSTEVQCAAVFIPAAIVGLIAWVKLT